MTFPYKIGVDRCIGSCNSKNNPYYKVCLPDSIKNISVKSLDLISQELITKNISFHKSCKCSCLLDKNVCNSLQKWNGKKSRCECLKIQKYKIGYSWNINNCRCEFKKLARLIASEKYDIEADKIKDIECKSFLENKTIIKKIRNCKPFIGVSILLLCVSLVFRGTMIHFYLKRRNKILPY